MKPAELFLLLLAAWTLLGALGISLRLLRGEREIPRRHLLWMLGTWAAYIALLLTVSLLQPAKIYTPGQDQCFDDMCFAVVGVHSLPGFLIHDGSHLLQVQLRITNRGRTHPEGEALLHTYIRDSDGHVYLPLRGLSGIRLTSRISPGASSVSEPVFRIAAGASGLRLILTRGKRQPGVLVIGDPDSLLHRPSFVPLPQ